MRVIGQSEFFFRIADESRLDQNGRNVGCFEHREPRAFDTGFMQASDAPELFQDRIAHAQAVVDLRRGRQIEQKLAHFALRCAVQIDATDPVSSIFFAGKPTRGGARGASFAQHKN